MEWNNFNLKLHPEYATMKSSQRQRRLNSLPPTGCFHLSDYPLATSMWAALLKVLNRYHHALEQSERCPRKKWQLPCLFSMHSTWKAEPYISKQHADECQEHGKREEP